MAQRTYYRVPKPKYLPANVNWNAYQSMSIEDLQKAVKMSRQKARRRLKSLADAGIKSTPATEALKRQIKAGKVRPFRNSPIPNVSTKTTISTYNKKKQEEARQRRLAARETAKEIAKQDKAYAKEIKDAVREYKKRITKLTREELKRLEKARASEVRRQLIMEDIELARFTEMKTSTVKGFTKFEENTAKRIGAEYDVLSKDEKRQFWAIYEDYIQEAKDQGLSSGEVQKALAEYVTQRRLAGKSLKYKVTDKTTGKIKTTHPHSGNGMAKAAIANRSAKLANHTEIRDEFSEILDRMVEDKIAQMAKIDDNSPFKLLK